MPLLTVNGTEYDLPEPLHDFILTQETELDHLRACNSVHCNLCGRPIHFCANCYMGSGMRFQLETPKEAQVRVAAKSILPSASKDEDAES